MVAVAAIPWDEEQQDTDDDADQANEKVPQDQEHNPKDDEDESHQM
jgi:hypothetical protein